MSQLTVLVNCLSNIGKFPHRPTHGMAVLPQSGRSLEKLVPNSAVVSRTFLDGMSSCRPFLGEMSGTVTQPGT